MDNSGENNIIQGRSNNQEATKRSIDNVAAAAASIGSQQEADGEYLSPSCNSVVFSLKNQVGGLAKALHVFKVLTLT